MTGGKLMQVIGLIGGTGSDFSIEHAEEILVETSFGTTTLIKGSTPQKTPLYVLARHGDNHTYLSNMINHRANIAALKEVGVSAIIATTSCGLIDTTIPLASPVIFDDLFFPDNRLPGGIPCTFYQTPGESGRSHLIAPSHFSQTVRSALEKALDNMSTPSRNNGCYCYALGPRFNSHAEIRAMQHVGGTMVSQTAAPEAILSAELEIPYGLIGLATDYANGVTSDITSIDELNQNIEKAGEIFNGVCLRAADILAKEEVLPFDTGFNYRFF